MKCKSVEGEGWGYIIILQWWYTCNYFTFFMTLKTPKKEFKLFFLLVVENDH